MRCDEVLLGRDRIPSLASLRSIPCDDVEDLDVSSDNLGLCPRRSPWARGLEGFVEGAEGVRWRGFGGARNPSYSKKSSWAPTVGLSSFFFLSEDMAPFFRENIFLHPTDRFCRIESCIYARAIILQRMDLNLNLGTRYY